MRRLLALHLVLQLLPATTAAPAPQSKPAAASFVRIVGKAGLSFGEVQAFNARGNGVYICRVGVVICMRAPHGRLAPFSKPPSGPQITALPAWTPPTAPPSLCVLTTAALQLSVSSASMASPGHPWNYAVDGKPGTWGGAPAGDAKPSVLFSLVGGPAVVARVVLSAGQAPCTSCPLSLTGARAELVAKGGAKVGELQLGDVQCEPPTSLTQPNPCGGTHFCSKPHKICQPRLRQHADCTT
jgi:hypothetical protein